MADGGGDLTLAPWAGALIGGGATALAAFLVWLAQRLVGKAALQTALNDGFGKFMAAYTAENDALKAELRASRQDREVLKLTLDRERLETAAERAQLRGEIANLTQALASLKTLLRKQGIPLPADRPPYSAESPGPGMLILEQTPPDTDE